MQRTMDRVGRIRVGSSVVTLRMSIGIASGKIDFFTAGSQHRELLVAGPVATETVLMEGIADAGEIALTPALAELLDPECIGPAKGGARLLSGPPEAPAGRSPDVGDVVAADVASCIPVAAREHVLLERSEPEHRMITATFFELMQTDEILARLGPAGFATALDERIRSIEEAAARYQVPFNVTDVSKGAIKVLLSAGAPSSTGHDEEQTLRLVREVMDEPGVIPMRVGVHSGRVFTGDFGPPYRRTYAVLGDAINTAARVMAQAAPGQVLATEEVLARSRTTFETTPIEPFHAKGKVEPVRASLVGAITGRREERISDAPFVGRERELAALRTVLSGVEAGNGWVVEVGGPSGIGKTRLLREAFASAPGVRVLHATCEEYESSSAYFALREPMRELLGLAHEAAPAEVERRLREVVTASAPQLVPWVPLLGILRPRPTADAGERGDRRALPARSARRRD
jgi:class 3 adenylate cyclase